ncbi:tRNA (adenosine(37)-N6)-threonylcarbamoyltransferase complex ATPase subunit type 1 TsaE [candidate division WOR-3 bacterium RBG_13_43_14]|uniref:tRNA threonylcarbamoyladenosine biosynthesis protein TsaE n=1 Tax=candidate division WOR-3 bacterium RBG_13_43_14 TaxID=1802590 RepID=A0A1F4U442_UNCW3|nr:MAG: tRNA (adenosine(37)-N6)-threonylcarbamoyltransferase complex ATPase subunit type 1 TsaE [candidate division WOR-3 bacterium RBG_13_43_14]
MTIINKKRKLISRSVEETIDHGVSFARDLVPGDIVYLSGELGSGKTVFIKGICSGLGVMTEVTSPSFVIATQYQGKLPVAHIDLYRLDVDGVRNLPLDDYLLSDGITVIEWAERVLDMLPGIMIRIEIVDQVTREISIEDNRH